VELLGGFGDSVLDDGVLGGLSAVIIDIDALVDRGFVEADGVDGGGGDPFFPADKRELAEDRNEGRRKVFESKVGKPEAEIELVGHKF
jgi:hypothetical protein